MGGDTREGTSKLSHKPLTPPVRLQCLCCLADSGLLCIPWLCNASNSLESSIVTATGSIGIMSF